MKLKIKEGGHRPEVNMGKYISQRVGIITTKLRRRRYRGQTRHCNYMTNNTSGLAAAILDCIHLVTPRLHSGVKKLLGILLNILCYKCFRYLAFLSNLCSAVHACAETSRMLLILYRIQLVCAYHLLYPIFFIRYFKAVFTKTRILILMTSEHFS